MAGVKVLGGGAEKALSVDQFFDYLTKIKEEEGDGTTHFAKVSWVYRAVNLRASALSRIPYQVLRGETELDWPINLKGYLRTTEADCCLSGAGYWLKKASQVKLQGLQRLNPWTMTVLTEADKRNDLTEAKDGIYGFKQEIPGKKPQFFKPGQIVYFDHFYNPKDDLGPGIAPAQPSSVPAQLVQNMNTWAAKFFENGAVPLMLLETEGTIKEAEQKRIGDAWNRLLQSVRKMWRTVILQKGLQAKVIGSPVKDLAMPGLDMRVKEQIAAAYGVPMALLEQGPINRATAEIHWISFYTDTIIPEAEQIAEIITDDLMADLGLEFKFLYNEVEAIQKQEAEKAQATSVIIREVNNSVNTGTLLVPEGRALIDVMLRQMGMPGLDELGLEEMPEPQAPVEGQEEGGEEPPDEETTKKVFGAAPAALWSELARWKKTGRRHFDSSIIPEWLNGLVGASIDAVGAEDAFLFLKQQRAREAVERRLQGAVEPVLDEYLDNAARAVQEGGSLGYDGLSSALAVVLLPELQTIATQRVLEIAAEIGVQFDPAVINTEALAWARAYNYELVHGLTETTRGQVSGAVQAFIENPTLGIDDIRALLEPAFGPIRAEMIAITEVTRAYSQAQNFYQEMLARYGIHMTRFWSTAMDDAVCPICGPLEGRPESVWGKDYPDGPPAHPRCRCDTYLGIRKR